jgi:diacylglycerol kinase (ATP)
LKHARLFINCNSRNGRTSRDRILSELDAAGFSVPLPEFNNIDDLKQHLQLNPSEEVDAIVVAGGDGTLNAAAKALVPMGLPVGLIPCGTANDLARTLGIPADIASAVEIIRQGNIREVDIGQVNDCFFFNVASIGMSAELAAILTTDIKRRFGRFGYALAAIRVLMRAKPFHADIYRRGVRHKSYTLQIAVGNGRYYGGGNIVERYASIDDGLLDLYSLEFSEAWRMLFRFRAFSRGEHVDYDDVRFMNGTEFEIRTRRPRPVNADGEIVTTTPARFRLLPRAIRIFAPPASPAQTEP